MVVVVEEEMVIDRYRAAINRNRSTIVARVQSQTHTHFIDFHYKYASKEIIYL